MTNDDIGNIASHHEQSTKRPELCLWCGLDWPCDTARLADEVERLREQAKADRRLIASTNQALTRALERAETAEGHTLFEGSVEDYWRRDWDDSTVVAIVLAGNHVERFDDLALDDERNNRVRVVAADPAPTDKPLCQHSNGAGFYCALPRGHEEGDPPTGGHEGVWKDTGRNPSWTGRFHDDPSLRPALDDLWRRRKMPDAADPAVDMPGPDTTEGGR